MSWVIYGATGYTGKLIAEHAVKRGLKPLLAGRSEEKLAPLAKELGLEHRAVSIDDAAGLRKLLEGKKVVVHAAGPFVRTAKQMAEACLDTQTHYVDITGEVKAMEAVYALDARAKERGVVLVTAGGFDVVPTDCLAAYVAQKAPGGARLEIDIFPKGAPSAGTMASLLGMIESGGLTRRGGELVHAPLLKNPARVRFPRGEMWSFPSPLGDLASGFRSTGIPEIVTRMAMPDRQATFLKAAGAVSGLTEAALKLALTTGPIRGALEKRVAKIQGANEQKRGRGYCQVRAKVTGPNGSAEAWMETPDGYTFTYEVVLLEVDRLLKTDKRGALAPSQAFGVDFALEVPGTKRIDTL
ncbi:MAG: saccharopine dehydrogenase NADP-binding domain-containing protein [Myxococcaceae bacterium]